LADPALRYTFPLQGLRKDSKYRVTFQDGSSQNYTAAGDRLKKPGVAVRLSVPNSSELIFFDELK
jgi:hypothetical protein